MGTFFAFEVWQKEAFEEIICKASEIKGRKLSYQEVRGILSRIIDSGLNNIDLTYDTILEEQPLNISPKRLASYKFENFMEGREGEFGSILGSLSYDDFLKLKSEYADYEKELLDDLDFNSNLEDDYFQE